MVDAVARLRTREALGVRATAEVASLEAESLKEETNILLL